MFNIVQFEVPGRKILDLFGGTGQLGIEALSLGRGALHLCGPAQRCGDPHQKQFKSDGFGRKRRVVQGDSLGFLQNCGEQFDVIFLDPPYRADLLERAVEAIAAFDILREHGIMVCESALDKVLPTLNAPYERGKEYRYGKIKLTIYRKTGRELHG